MSNLHFNSRAPIYEFGLWEIINSLLLNLTGSALAGKSKSIHNIPWYRGGVSDACAVCKNIAYYRMRRRADKLLYLCYQNILFMKSKHKHKHL